MPSLDPWQVVPTVHAIEAYRIHHPEAERLDVQRGLRDAEEIDPIAAHGLAGRVRAPNPGDRFFLAADRQGVFVVAAGRGPLAGKLALITYLRFQASQVRFACQHWGPPRSGRT